MCHDDVAVDNTVAIATIAAADVVESSVAVVAAVPALIRWLD